MTVEDGEQRDARLTGRRVLVVGIKPEVNGGVVERLRNFGIAAHGSTSPATAADEFDDREFDLIAFGRGILGPTSDRLKVAFRSRNRTIRFVDVIGPMAVNHILATLKADPATPRFVKNLGVSRDPQGYQISLQVLMPCLIAVTLFRRTAAGIAANQLGRAAAAPGPFVLPISLAQFSEIYSLVVDAEGEEYLHYPFLDSQGSTLAAAAKEQ